MTIIADLFCFLAGAFLTNAMPHFISGVRGERFPTPFAKPPGRGLSPPLVNVLWGFANLVVGYVFLPWAGQLNTHPRESMVFFGAGVLVMAVVCARIFDGVIDSAAPPR